MVRVFCDATGVCDHPSEQRHGHGQALFRYKRSQRLASILAQIDWRREVDRISRRELIATRQVVEAYNEALAEARAKSGDRVAGNRMQPADLFQHSK